MLKYTQIIADLSKKYLNTYITPTKNKIPKLSKKYPAVATQL